MKLKKSNDNSKETLNIPNSIISVISVIVAIISLFIAWQANQKAGEANRLMEQSLKSDVEITRLEDYTKVDLILMGCTDSEKFEWMMDIVSAPMDITLSNKGGADTSLIYVLATDKKVGYAVELSEDYETSKKIRLPLDIPAGTSRRFFVSLKFVPGLYQYASEDDALKNIPTVIEEVNDIPITWEFLFGNSSRLEYVTEKSLWRIESNPTVDLSSECSYFKQ